MATWGRVVAPIRSYLCLAPARSIRTTAVVSEKAVGKESPLVRTRSISKLQRLFICVVCVCWHSVGMSSVQEQLGEVWLQGAD